LEFTGRSDGLRERHRFGGDSMRGTRHFGRLGLTDRLELDRDPPVLEMHARQRSRFGAAIDDETRQRLDHGTLDGALERARSVLRVHPPSSQLLNDSVVDLDQELAAHDPLAKKELAKLATGDLTHDRLVKRVEHDDAIDTVEELRAEEFLRLVQVVLLQSRPVVAAAGRESERRSATPRCAKVRGHDHDRVVEVGGLAGGVSETSLSEDSK